MTARRLVQLTAVAANQGFDAVALVPGANLFYLTGLSFHLSERPVVALFSVDGEPAIVLPALEAPKVAQATIKMRPFPYTDEEGYALAFSAACSWLELADARVGVEGLHMRLLEARILERYAPGCSLVTADDALAQLRLCKDESELARMRLAIAFTEQALQATLDQVRPGQTEKQIVGILTGELLHAGGESIAFGPHVVGGPNAASPHANPSDRAVRPGEMLVMDFGITVGGYASDITRTVALGQPDPELARVYEVVLQANAAGRAKAGPGVPAQEVDRAARAVIDAAGYGEFFIHRTGHGLGLEVHEPPYIVEGNTLLLQPGMVFTVEPGIYLPGRGGVRIEDDVLITESGAESLTSFPRELIVLSP